MIEDFDIERLVFFPEERRLRYKSLDTRDSGTKSHDIRTISKTRRASATGRHTQIETRSRSKSTTRRLSTAMEFGKLTALLDKLFKKS